MVFKSHNSSKDCKELIVIVILTICTSPLQCIALQLADLIGIKENRAFEIPGGGRNDHYPIPLILNYCG